MLILYRVGTSHRHWVHSWTIAEFELSMLLDWHLHLVRVKAMINSVELNDFFLEEWSGLLAFLVIHATRLRPVRLERVQPSEFCFGLTDDSVSLLTAAVGSLDVISLTRSSTAVAIVHECLG